MLINYWECKFNDYDESFDGEEETRIYGCSHSDNETKYCEPDNKWCNDKAECPIAMKETK